MTPLHKKIYTDLKLAIDDLRYVEGELLPSENEICARYNTTRSTVRIALNKLADTGYIDTRKGKHRLQTREGFGHTVNKRGYGINRPAIISGAGVPLQQ